MSESKDKSSKETDKKQDKTVLYEKRVAPKGEHKGEPIQPIGTPEVDLPGG
jgi:hypothetical protein